VRRPQTTNRSVPALRRPQEIYPRDITANIVASEVKPKPERSSQSLTKFADENGFRACRSQGLLRN
jgi:hypothetical protein